ncbi:hypothetical protein RB195_002737 [Necator americanus]|uniref:Ground-like domain-containing protein n=1 Tax=Necator americanus TaxID=51031 RepID=A0ABR1DKG3_NECAM
MTTAGFFLIVVLTRPSVVSSIFFDLLNGLGPHYPTCVCAPPPCAAAATASATSLSQSQSIAGSAPVAPYGGGYQGGGYGGPPPPVYPQGYPYKHRRRRAVLVNAAHSEECTSDAVGSIMEQSMSPSIIESRERIRQSLQTHYGRETVVLCSPSRAVFTVTDGAEFCERWRNGINCYAFVF